MSGSTRITNVQLAERLDTFIKVEGERHDAIQADIKKQGEKIDQVLAKINAQQVDIAICNQDRVAIKKDIDGLEGRVNRWSVVNSLGAVIGMILGWLGINK